MNYWKEEYPGLPQIPLPKQWLPQKVGEFATSEQIIVSKLISNEEISIDEINLMKECINFYNDLRIRLNNFNYSTINETNINDFIGYIDYAYNFVLLNSNRIELFETYRLVFNEDFKSKGNIKELSYPPIETVREKKLFNRANSYNSNVFYSSESIDTTFKELRPEKSSIVTLGVWRPKGNNTFLSYPIMANPSVPFLSEISKFSTNAYCQIKNRFHPLMGEFMDGYFNLLNQEYSKGIQNKIEYILSANFSEKIFELRENDWTYDCIVYPSVGNEYISSNLAFRPSVVDKRLNLVAIIEFEVLNTKYDLKANINSQRLITVAELKIRNKAKVIENNGNIVWEKYGCNI